MPILNELSSAQVREIGISLNQGRPYGWRENLANLTGASAYTIRSWCDSESAATHRTCSGPAARLLIILAYMQKKKVIPATFLDGFDGIDRSD